MSPIAPNRPSPIAGTWYPDDAEVLRDSVNSYLSAAIIPPLEGSVIALIAPHAGLRYSGLTAGYAFRAVQGQSFPVVMVVSPLHGYNEADLLTTAHSAYVTPLGAIPVDQIAVVALQQILRRENAPTLTPIAEDEEHSLEIELPFLQCALAQPFKLLPVMMRTQSLGHASTLGLALAEVAGSQPTLLVASSDLSHFYSESEAEVMDAAMLDQIGSFSPEGIYQAEQTGAGFACGFMAIAAVLFAARALGADRVQVLHHSTSAAQTGDRSSVVGYGAAAVLKPI